VRSLEGKRVLLTGSSGFIGTSLVDLLISCGAEVVNADIRPPLVPKQGTFWRRCDVGSADELRAVTADIDPHFVLHLAARTDTDSDVVADYDINHIGTDNVVRALRHAPGVARFVFVSTQFVLGPGVPFESETQFAPHTAYGESKVRAERQLRATPPEVPWTIVRPTNVWGPWHLRYQREFWRVLRRGLYLHPTTPDPIRSYGYVGSVCLQTLAVLLADEAAVHGRALYVGDEPIRLSQWVDAFSVALRGKPARRVPGAAIAGLARVGDLAKKARLPAPISSSRYRSMTQDYPTPMHRTAECLGRLPAVPLQLGVAETVRWLDGGDAADVRKWLTCDPPALGRKEEETSG
jgi:nucleoside-diphosphate-sugar epimerase